MFVDTFRTPQGHNQSKPFESYQVSCWNFWTYEEGWLSTDL